MAAFTPIFGQNLRSQPPRRTAGRPNNEPRQLEFNEAMKDFKTMFPTMDNDVIEAVLRANNGLVDATIDQLLSMGAGDVCSDSSSGHPHLPSYTARELAEPPPAYTPRLHSEADSSLSLPRPLPVRPYSNWNPPLLGALPDDFLRISPVRATQRFQEREHHSDVELKRFLEDERLAIFLQNEEFMRELRHNKDFMISLERDRQSAQSREPVGHTANTGHGRVLPTLPDTEEEVFQYVPAPVVRPSQTESQVEPVQVARAVGGPNTPSHHGINEDAAFREKLKHMGKSTRKQFDKLAKMFHRKDVHRAEIIASGSAASTANLLEDYEKEEEDEGLLNAMSSGRLEIMNESQETTEDESVKANNTNHRNPATDLNQEPIVFFAEDNEFQFKEEKG